jgi:anti-sigma B factor antagonist
MLARVSDEHDGAVVIARVEGEIDASNAARIGARLRASLTNQSTALIVDLSAATYLDSAGINLLFALGEELPARRQQLYLVVAPEAPIARLLAITGLDRAVATHATRAAAVERAAALGS